MFSRSRFAYKMLVASVVLVPTWGCNSEPPPTPPDIQKQTEGLETETGEMKVPEIDLGSGSEDGSEKKEGSDTK